MWRLFFLFLIGFLLCPSQFRLLLGYWNWRKKTCMYMLSSPSCNTQTSIYTNHFRLRDAPTSMCSSQWPNKQTNRFANSRFSTTIWSSRTVEKDKISDKTIRRQQIRKSTQDLAALMRLFPLVFNALFCPRRDDLDCIPDLTDFSEILAWA